VPVQYLLFEDEGHGFANGNNRVEALETYLSFLNKYLKFAAVPSSAAVGEGTETVDAASLPSSSASSLPLPLLTPFVATGLPLLALALL